MSGRALKAWLVWLLAMLAGSVIVLNTRFTADMSFFLPRHPSGEQQVLIDQVKDGSVARLMIAAIEGDDELQRAKLSIDLRARLLQSGLFVQVQNGQAGSEVAEKDLLLQHRYLLSPEISPQRFSTEGLAAAIGESIDLLNSPVGQVLKPVLMRDPTGELWAQLSRMTLSSNQPESSAGVWSSRDGQRSLLLMQTRASGVDTDGQELALAAVRDAFEESRRTQNAPQARLLLTGAGQFAVNARSTIKNEVGRLTLLGALAVSVVLLLVYRSPKLLALGLLPVISGALAGVVAVSMAFGTVFAITIGFGSALIGEAVDYAIYYFVQSGRIGTAAWRERFWPTVRLGVLTSLVGFGVLIGSGFPGLAQLGLYALSGILVAALVTRYVLPEVAPARNGLRDLKPWGERLAALSTGLRRLKWGVVGLSMVAAGYLVAQQAALWTNNISVLSTAQSEDILMDQALRADINAPDARYMLVVSGPDREAALRLSERVGGKLDQLVKAGVLLGYDTPSRLLPSEKAQRERQAVLPDTDTLRKRLQAALADLPLSMERLSPFLADVEAARSQPLVTRQTLDGSALSLIVDSLLIQRASGWSVLLPLHPPASADGRLQADIIRAAVDEDGVLFMDMKAELDGLYKGYLDEAITLCGGGVLAVLVLLAFALRSARLLLTVMIPLLMSCVLLLAGLHMAGEQLHLMHLVGLLLVVAVGSNYALFFVMSSRRQGMEPQTLAALGLANVTTAIGFGVLAFSSVPILQAIGVTVGPGAVLALLMAAIFSSQEVT